MFVIVKLYNIIVMMKKLWENRQYFYIVVSVFILALFFYMAYKTPLAGDDWGYALNGMNSDPFSMAIEFYKSWSGRFFSELYGFIVAPRKWLWNIINPLLFMGTFICICHLIGIKRRPILIPLVVLACILSVDDSLRMETYSWLMGTTYVIPLFLSLLYLLIARRLLFKVGDLEKGDKVLALLSNGLLLYIGLAMENIAAVMILICGAFVFYAYHHKRQASVYFVINTLVAIVSFTVMRLSPGSAYRLLNEHVAWSQMSLFEKLADGYPRFIYYTFINNNYLILFYALVMSLFVLGMKISVFVKILLIFIQALSVVAVFSFVLPFDFLLDPSSLFSRTFWIVDIIASLFILFKGLKERRRDEAVFIFLAAGSFNIVMLYSPIFGARSSIYTVFYLIILIGMIIEELKGRSLCFFCLLALALFVNLDRVSEYLFKYQLVGVSYAERLDIIAYYKDHPEVKEAYIPRFPIYTVHGGDIEPDDSYHLETFKEYYGLPQQPQDIIFYFKES